MNIRMRNPVRGVLQGRVIVSWEGVDNCAAFERSAKGVDRQVISINSSNVVADGTNV